MKRIFCTLEGGLLQARLDTYKWIENITDSGFNPRKLWAARHRQIVNPIAADHPIWNTRVIEALRDYKDQGYEVYIVAENYDSQRVIPVDFHNLECKFIDRSEAISLLNAKEDVYIGNCFKDLPLFSAVQEAVVSGPWWFQWIVSLKRRASVNAIDTESGFIVQNIKNFLNILPPVTGIILAPIGLALRLMNSMVSSLGHPIEMLIISFIFLWPILLQVETFNEDLKWCGRAVLVNFIIKEQKNTIVGTNKDQQKYIFNNYAFDLHLLLTALTHLLLIIVAFCNKKAFLLTLGMLLSMVFFSRKYVISISTLLYPFLTHKTQVIRIISKAISVFWA